MVTHSPSTPKTLLGRSTSNVSLPLVAECAVVPHRQGNRTPIFPGNEPLLSDTPDVPATQTTLEHTDRDRGWRSSNISSTPNAGYTTPGETGTLQPPDSDSTDPQLQRSHPRSPRSQPSYSVKPRALSTHRRNLSFREPPVAPEGNRLPRHTQN